MRKLWTEPVVDFAGKWVKLETCRLDPKPIQKPHVPIIVGGYADAAIRRAVRFGAGWYGFNRDPADATQMIDRLDTALAQAGRRRGDGFEIIMTPPASMPLDAMQQYAEVGVDRLVVNLGSQRPERVDARMTEIEQLVKQMH
jgi:alkanesulfonate monooxygenase SsuD/methylene tetrahydromethanopterin reductase-like flavin-dependent oxidoreductase (luciferase family)